jgi:hypothetical protein
MRQCFICNNNLVCEKCLVSCSSCGKDFCALVCQFYECETCFPLQDINYCTNCKCPCLEEKLFKKEIIEESRAIFTKEEIIEESRNIFTKKEIIETLLTRKETIEIFGTKEHAQEEALKFLKFCETKCKTATEKLFMQKQLEMFQSSF